MPARRTALACSLAATLSIAATVHAAPFVYVSNAEDAEVSAYALDRQAGSLQAIGRVPAAKLVMPMAVSGGALHAVSRTQPYQVFSYRVDGGSGKLEPLGATPLPDSMVSTLVDASGRWLLSASYGGNVLSVHRLEAGGRVAAEPTQLAPSGGVKPHALKLDRSGRWLVVPHLGTDEIRVYRFDAERGQIDVDGARSVKVPAGTGPRHLVFSPDGRMLYVLGELNGQVMAFEQDAASGELKLKQSIASVPADTGLVPGQPRVPTGTPGAPVFDASKAIWCADIQITPDGRYLYTSERTQGRLSGFAVDRASGELRLLGQTPTEAQPRGFAIDASGGWLVASGEKSTNLSLYAIDGQTGSLKLRQQVPTGRGANWVSIVDRP